MADTFMGAWFDMVGSSEFLQHVSVWLVWTLGPDGADLGVRHMAARAVVVFVITILIVRLGKKRFLSQNTAFDAILGIILGSIVSRAITGQSPFVPTLCAALVLVGLHRLFARIALQLDGFGTLTKGSTRILVRDGEVDWNQMRRSNMSQNDLLEALRLKASLTDWAQVKEARLERSGDISVIPMEK